MGTTAPARADEARATTRGTPCAQSWDEAWVAQVEAREEALDQRICGARTTGGTPCALASDHESGRCRHHGGFPLTGAPADNRNAVVHGLYSRRLMVCGSHCPVWQSCPMGGGSAFALPTFPSEGETPSPGGAGFQPACDQSNGARLNEQQSGPASRAGWKPAPPEHEPTSPEQKTRPRVLEIHPLSHGQQLLKMPMTERPVCPFETSEYNAVVTDVMQRTQANTGHGYGLHLAHQIALMTVMVSRAARALTVAPLTEKLVQSGENFHASYERPSAALQAYERLSRELRRWIVLIDPNFGGYRVSPETQRQHTRRRQYDTNVDPDSLAELDASSGTSRVEPNAGDTATQELLRAMDQRIMGALLGRMDIKPKEQTADTAQAAAKRAEEEQQGGLASSRNFDPDASLMPERSTQTNNSPPVILSDSEESPRRDGQVRTDRVIERLSTHGTEGGEADGQILFNPVSPVRGSAVVSFKMP